MNLSIAVVLLASPQGMTGSVFPGDGTVARNSEHVHDPTVIAFGGMYFCFSTSGDGFGVLRSSKDLRSWKVHGPILPSQPEWLAKRYAHKSIWAPDVVVMGKRLRLYYCASEFGTNQSVIGMAECDDFDPKNPQKGWRDVGLVYESQRGRDTFNAIDPEVAVDEGGRHWMFFGSYFAGLYAVELNPSTGMLKEGAPPILVARNTGERGNPLEACAVIRREGYYYLFVSYGLAAQGVRSTYRIMVGRSKEATGPYVDAAGKPMTEGGHVNVLKSSPPMFGPGHSDVLRAPDGRWLMPYHFYDARQNWHGDTWGLPTLQIRELLWTADGWPVPGMPVEARPPKARSVFSKDLVGQWTHQVDFGRPSEVELSNDGRARNGDQKGTWTLSGDQVTIRWPSSDAPGRMWIDRLTVGYGGTYYAGRNTAGAVIRGVRKGR
ncbi:MAG: arabinan endo-1,5-alpha-L-arabinosidase [Fimbriimonas sp.]